MPTSGQAADGFEQHRGRLRSIAYRMLGSLSEAEDAVQETWVRLDRTDTSDVANLDGWLTTVIGRICLNMLRAQQSRPDQPAARRSSRLRSGHRRSAILRHHRATGRKQTEAVKLRPPSGDSAPEGLDSPTRAQQPKVS